MIERELMLKAECGDARAMYELGCYYYNQKCFSFAFFWINKSAKLKNTDAMYELGNYYRKGVGTQIDLKKAHKWFIKASKSKNTLASTALVDDYIDGVYKSNSKHALGLCKKAAKQNSSIGEYYLGLCYFKGIGVKRNVEKARYHFTMSAINGFEFAKAQLNDKVFSVVV